LLDDRRIRIRIQSRIRIRIQEAQKHVDPVDPDPQHCFFIPYPGSNKKMKRVEKLSGTEKFE
jgi:hypothetical protein